MILTAAQPFYLPTLINRRQAWTIKLKRVIIDRNMIYPSAPDTQPSLLTVSQHELANFLPIGEQADEQFVYCVARACLPHCIAAIDEIEDASPDSHIDDLIDFLEEYGAHDQAGQGRTEYYRDGVGWLHTPLADRERATGKAVIMQNLAYGLDADIEPAITSGRVRRKAWMWTRICPGWSGVTSL